MNVRELESIFIILILILLLPINMYGALGFQQITPSPNSYTIYIYHDESYPTSWFSEYDSMMMIKYLEKTFQTYNITYYIVDAEELADTVSNSPPNNTIIIFTQDVAPYTVWNGSRDSLIIRWIHNGGVVIWTGDWEFYYIGFSNGTIKHIPGIENILFSHQVTTSINVTVSPSGLASKYIPSLKPFKSRLPFSSSYTSGMYTETYGKYTYANVKYMDPALIQVDKGYFIKVGGTSADELTSLDRSVYIAELVLNRFLNYNVSLTRGMNYFHPYDSGIVYILPSNISSPYWKLKYGDRIYFYTYENLSNYTSYIDYDLKIIQSKYKFIILILPLDNTSLFYYNIKLMDSLASRYGLKILYGIFPKWKFGDEWNYLYEGTTANNVMNRNIHFFSELSSTMGVGIWYGWENRTVDPYEIRDFYLNLPKNIRHLYMVWLDEEYVSPLTDSGLPDIVDPLNITVVTEMYDNYTIALYGCSYKKQIIITGVWDAENTDVWRGSVRSRLDYLLPPSKNIEIRRLGVWIYYDLNDGSNERYHAYIDGELTNPFSQEPPDTIYLSMKKRFYLTWLFDKTISVDLCFTWSDKYPASNLDVEINRKSYTTDSEGYIHLNITSYRPGICIYSIKYAMWNTHILEVYNRTPIFILVLVFPPSLFKVKI